MANPLSQPFPHYEVISLGPLYLRNAELYANPDASFQEYQSQMKTTTIILTIKDLLSLDSK